MESIKTTESQNVERETAHHSAKNISEKNHIT